MAAPSPTENISLRQHLTYICSRFLAYGLPLLFFLVVVSFYLKTYDSAQIKITFTQIGTTVLFVVWVAKMFIEGRWPFTKKDIVYIAPLLAWLASGFVAYLHTPFKVWSLEETLRRFFYVVLALVSFTEFRSEERLRRLWRWLITAAWFAIGYGVIQYIDSRFFQGGPGIDPFIWRQAFGPRVFSTFGNPNFYGNFLVIITPIILASVLRGKSALSRPLILVFITMVLVFVIDKSMLGYFGGYDKSFQVVYAALASALVFLFVMVAFWGIEGRSQIAYLVLFGLLFINLYATETKGAWVGFTAALGVTLWLIFEYFLHFDEILVESRKYLAFVATLAGLLGLLLIAMTVAFVVPLFHGQVEQIGFQILWVPTLLAAIVSVFAIAWFLRRPWNVKKMIYGVLLFFIVGMGAVVLQFARTRLTSVSFRLFTWISTWEMVRTHPVLGNGVGTFKVIYPAYRRPQIIVLEAKSNTETDHAEDEYVEVWQDEGLIGFGVFLWLIATALVVGLKQLRWYSKSRSPDGKRSAFKLEGEERSYEVLGYVGAYIGALIHWCVDVSVRFVSSGIFSGLLPGILLTYARNHGEVVANEARLPYDRWIRVGLAASWTIILMTLGVELVPNAWIQGGDTSLFQIVLCQVLVGVGLYVLIELVERGNAPKKAVPFAEQYPAPADRWLAPRVAGVALVGAAGAFGFNMFRNHFWADVHHNLAIFFSKEGIWTKAPKYDSRMLNFPPDIRKKYVGTGGALEHYEEVAKRNPGFPMALYFTGNVYNDRGSEAYSDSMTARGKGDMEEATRLRDKALDMWDKAEDAYSRTKKLAPNYVQTHHQMGLLDLKRAELYSAWNDQAKAAEWRKEAEKNFRLYKMLDPVFPPNYDRLIQLALVDQRYDEAIALYKEAIYYNDVVATSINGAPFADRLSVLCLGLAKLYFTRAHQLSPHPFNPPMPEIQDALKYFKLAAQYDPKLTEAWQGIGVISSQTGHPDEAAAAKQKLQELAAKSAPGPAPVPAP